MGSEVPAGEGTTGLGQDFKGKTIARGSKGCWANWHGLSVIGKVLAWFDGGIPLALENASSREIPFPTITLYHDDGGNNRKALKGAPRGDMAANTRRSPVHSSRQKERSGYCTVLTNSGPFPMRHRSGSETLFGQVLARCNAFFAPSGPICCGNGQPATKGSSALLW